MAGSYNHCVTDAGNLYLPHQLAHMLENPGDVYEAVEEMYGMIWWLAHLAPDAGAMSAEDLVDMARKNYALGLALAKKNKNKAKRRS